MCYDPGKEGGFQEEVKTLHGKRDLGRRYGPRDARLGLADRSHCQIFEWKEDLEAGTVGQENQ